MKISKKKLDKIRYLNVAAIELSKLDDPSRINGVFVKYPPDMWNEDEKILFDLVFQIEDTLKDQIIKIIQNNE